MNKITIRKADNRCRSNSLCVDTITISFDYHIIAFIWTLFIMHTVHMAPVAGKTIWKWHLIHAYDPFSISHAVNALRHTVKSKIFRK